MNDQTDTSHAVFMELTSKKMELQDKKIISLEEKLNAFPDNAEPIKELIRKIDDLQQKVAASVFPEKKLNDFCRKLDEGINLLKVPIQNKVQHHHYVPKLIWITAGLFIALSLVCAGWYNTGKKLDGYITNDTKYRYLKLNANQALQNYLYRLDSFYTANPNMRKDVFAGEDRNRQNLERMQKAEELKAEASNLERGVKKRI